MKQREIKFRAWDKIRQKFVFEGNLYQLEISIRQNTDWLKSKLEWIQFTGLKDKNGKEIYEGDILKRWQRYAYNDKYYSTKQLIEVKWQNSFSKCGFNIGRTNNPTFEIIGNIYENPDLIKK